MTREEVLYAIRTSACRGSDTKEWVYTEKDLMQSFDDLYFNNPEYNDSPSAEPCEDAISRQYLLDNCVVDKVTMPYIPVSKIKNALSVTPKQKMGHWEWLTEDKYRCSNCNHETRVDECMNKPLYDFCPFCGAKMEEEK